MFVDLDWVFGLVWLDLGCVVDLFVYCFVCIGGYLLVGFGCLFFVSKFGWVLFVLVCWFVAVGLLALGAWYNIACCYYICSCWLFGFDEFILDGLCWGLGVFVWVDWVGLFCYGWGGM